MSRAVCNCMRLGLPRCFRTYTRWIGFSEDDVNRRRRKMSGEAMLPTVEDNAFHRGSIATYDTRATFDSD